MSTSDVILKGKNKDKAYKKLRKQFLKLTLSMSNSGKLSSSSPGRTAQEVALKTAIENPDIEVKLQITEKNYVNESNGSKSIFAVGLYRGNSTDSKGIINAVQYINLSHAVVWHELGGGNIAKSIAHEIIEAYIGAIYYPNSGYENRQSAHDMTVSLEEPPEYYPIQNTHVEENTNIFQYMELVGKNNEKRILYTKEDIK